MDGTEWRGVGRQPPPRLVKGQQQYNQFSSSSSSSSSSHQGHLFPITANPTSPSPSIHLPFLSSTTFPIYSAFHLFHSNCPSPPLPSNANHPSIHPSVHGASSNFPVHLIGLWPTQPATLHLAQQFLSPFSFIISVQLLCMPPRPKHLLLICCRQWLFNLLLITKLNSFVGFQSLAFLSLSFLIFHRLVSSLCFIPLLIIHPYALCHKMPLVVPTVLSAFMPIASH